MAWTPPTPYTVNLLVTHTDLNTYVSNNQQYLKDNPFDPTNFGVAPKYGTASANLVLTGSYQAITGGSVVLDQTGDWTILASAKTILGDNGGASVGTASVQLVIAGGTQAGTLIFGLQEGYGATMSGQWAYNAGSQPVTAQLQAKVTGTFGGTLYADGTMLAALLCKAP